MKIFLLLSVLLSSTFAFADVPVVVAREMSCQELKETLHNYGSIKVRSTFLRLPISTTVHKEVKCSPFQTKHAGVFKTLDIRNCHVGFFCVRDHDRDFPRCHGRMCLH